MMDCEADRIEAGVIPFVGRPVLKLDSRGSLAVSAGFPPNSAGFAPNSAAANSGGRPPNSAAAAAAAVPTSVWEAIEKSQYATALFRNFSYAGDLNPTSLQPSLSSAALDLWSYYLEDPLAIGSAYDLEAAIVELRERESDKAESVAGIYHGLSSERKVIDLSYCRNLKTKRQGQKISPKFSLKAGRATFPTFQAGQGFKAGQGFRAGLQDH